MARARNRLDRHIETKLIVEDYDLDHAIRNDIRPEFFLELEGTFEQCPYCTNTDGWITPTREGQLVCVQKQCWKLVPWRDKDGHAAMEVEAVQNAREAIEVAHEVTTQKMHAPEKSEKTRTWRNTTRRKGKHCQRWDWGRPSYDGSKVPYMVAWASAGADRNRAKPYTHPPWEPDDALDTHPYEWDDVFPRGFQEKHVKCVQGPNRDPCDLDMYAYYNFVWTVTHVCIRRGVGLWRRPKVREYYDRVLTKTSWWRQGGNQRRGYALNASFVTIGPPSLFKQIVILETAPGQAWGSSPMSDVSGNNKRLIDQKTYRNSLMTNLGAKPREQDQLGAEDPRAVMHRLREHVPAVGRREGLSIRTAELPLRRRREKRPSSD
jgi:hypothetical protein